MKLTWKLRLFAMDFLFGETNDGTLTLGNILDQQFQLHDRLLNCNLCKQIL